LDANGAEKLVGKGDMLYALSGGGKNTRVQGSFVTNDERRDVTTFVKSRANANYDESIMTDIEHRLERSSGKAAAVGADDIPPMFANAGTTPSGAISPDLDDMFNAAVEVMLETGQASVSMLQRRLKLGYGRASRIVDQMEEHGIVGPFDGAKPRKLLISRDVWNELLYNE
jgi:S-DNA-T family DNA segregation ATPase FtsK/SpoIIIE